MMLYRGVRDIYEVHFSINNNKLLQHNTLHVVTFLSFAQHHDMLSKYFKYYCCIGKHAIC